MPKNRGGLTFVRIYNKQRSNQGDQWLNDHISLLVRNKRSTPTFLPILQQLTRK